MSIETRYNISLLDKHKVHILTKPYSLLINRTEYYLIRTKIPTECATLPYIVENKTGEKQIIQLNNYKIKESNTLGNIYSSKEWHPLIISPNSIYFVTQSDTLISSANVTIVAPLYCGSCKNCPSKTTSSGACCSTFHDISICDPTVTKPQCLAQADAGLGPKWCDTPPPASPTKIQVKNVGEDLYGINITVTDFPVLIQSYTDISITINSWTDTLYLEQWSRYGFISTLFYSTIQSSPTINPDVSNIYLETQISSYCNSNPYKFCDNSMMPLDMVLLASNFEDNTLYKIDYQLNININGTQYNNISVSLSTTKLAGKMDELSGSLSSASRGTQYKFSTSAFVHYTTEPSNTSNVFTYRINTTLPFDRFDNYATTEQVGLIDPQVIKFWKIPSSPGICPYIDQKDSNLCYYSLEGGLIHKPYLNNYNMIYDMQSLITLGGHDWNGKPFIYMKSGYMDNIFSVTGNHLSIPNINPINSSLTPPGVYKPPLPQWDRAYSLVQVTNKYLKLPWGWEIDISNDYHNAYLDITIETYDICLNLWPSNKFELIFNTFKTMNDNSAVLQFILPSYYINDNSNGMIGVDKLNSYLTEPAQGFFTDGIKWLYSKKPPIATVLAPKGGLEWEQEIRTRVFLRSHSSDIVIPRLTRSTENSKLVENITISGYFNGANAIFIIDTCANDSTLIGRYQTLSNNKGFYYSPKEISNYIDSSTNTASVSPPIITLFDPKDNSIENITNAIKSQLQSYEYVSNGIQFESFKLKDTVRVNPILPTGLITPSDELIWRPDIVNGKVQLKYVYYHVVPPFGPKIQGTVKYQWVDFSQQVSMRAFKYRLLKSLDFFNLVNDQSFNSWADVSGSSTTSWISNVRTKIDTHFTSANNSITKLQRASTSDNTLNNGFSALKNPVLDYKNHFGEVPEVIGISWEFAPIPPPSLKWNCIQKAGNFGCVQEISGTYLSHNDCTARCDK